MRSYWTAAILVVLGAITAGLLLLRSAPEPVYGGKSVGQWLDAGYEDAAKAMQEIGPNAGPYILAKLARVDSKYGSARRYRSFCAKLPANVRSILPKPESGNLDELRATSMLLELGPPITALLISGLSDPNPAVRMACARALGCLRKQGSDIGKAIPSLIAAQRDPTPEVAALAELAAGVQETPIQHSESLNANR